MILSKKCIFYFFKNHRQPVRHNFQQNIKNPPRRQTDLVRHNPKYDVKILMRTAMQLRQIGMNLKAALWKPNFQGIKCQP